MWRLSGLISPFSTRLTMSVSAAFAGVDKAELLALVDNEGPGLAGPEKWVKSLTGSLKLLR
jgi:hypothetical protein